MSTNLQTHFDASQLRDIGNKINDAIHDGIQNGVKQAAYVGATVAKEGGFKDRTGQLRLTIYGILEGWSGEWCWGLIHAPQKYASFVEFPTRPHDIWPMAAYNAASVLPGQSRRASGKGPHEHIVGRGQALRWVNGSGEHFARMVHHPGTVGFFFMRYAEQVAKRELEKSIRAFIRPI
jgi:hypothetical protein